LARNAYSRHLLGVWDLSLKGKAYHRNPKGHMLVRKGVIWQFVKIGRTVCDWWSNQKDKWRNLIVENWVSPSPLSSSDRNQISHEVLFGGFRFHRNPL